jgi:hypothetical protein
MPLRLVDETWWMKFVEDWRALDQPALFVLANLVLMPVILALLSTRAHERLPR